MLCVKILSPVEFLLKSMAHTIEKFSEGGLSYGHATIHLSYFKGCYNKDV